MNRLENKVAIVTACTRGIGLAVVKSFAAEGAAVYMAVRNPEAAAAIADELNAAGGNVRVVYVDASKKETYEPMIDEVLKNEGRIDVLVNNFGGTNPKYDSDIMNCKYENFMSGVEVNLSSVFIPSQLVINKAMIAQNSGSIINIGSVAGLVADTTQCAYGTAKAGIIHLSKMIATHAARYNIRCNVVCPGMTNTEERAKSVDFSINYVDAAQVIIVPKDSAIKTAVDLEGKNVGVQMGTTGDIYVTDNAKAKEVFRYKTGADAGADSGWGAAKAAGAGTTASTAWFSSPSVSTGPTMSSRMYIASSRLGRPGASSSMSLPGLRIRRRIQNASKRMPSDMTAIISRSAIILNPKMSTISILYS
jgi:NAD(P)-dependent dehydrogenase (short-subunit alcohol dehydrogenase family)